MTAAPALNVLLCQGQRQSMYPLCCHFLNCNVFMSCCPQPDVAECLGCTWRVVASEVRPKVHIHHPKLASILLVCRQAVAMRQAALVSKSLEALSMHAVWHGKVRVAEALARRTSLVTAWHAWSKSLSGAAQAAASSAQIQYRVLSRRQQRVSIYHPSSPHAC